MHKKWMSMLMLMALAVVSCNQQTGFNQPYLGQTPPGDTPQLFAPGRVSTETFNERDLSFSPDGKQLFFSMTELAKTEYSSFDIYTCAFKDGAWTSPQKAVFSSPYGDVEPFVTPDGRSLYFNSNRPATEGGDVAHWETWVVDQTDDGWSAPRRLEAPFNRVCHTTFSQTGRMYYTREDELAHYRAPFVDGKLGEPERLSDTINAVKVQYNGCIAPDESYLIFTRHSEDGFGDADLYISFRNDEDQWSEPVNLGDTINTAAKETCPSLSPDGAYFFFTSDKGGTSDVYWVDAKILESYRTNL